MHAFRSIRRSVLAALCLAVPAGAGAAPAPELTRPVAATAEAKALVRGNTDAERPGVIAARFVTSLRQSVAGRGDQADPTVTWRWRDRPAPGATQVVATVTVRGFADDSVDGQRWTIVIRRCDRWHLVGAFKQSICRRGVDSTRRLCL